jgi:hypothetical protein
MADHGRFGRGTYGGEQLTRRPFPTTTTIEWTSLLAWNRHRQPTTCHDHGGGRCMGNGSYFSGTNL